LRPRPATDAVLDRAATHARRWLASVPGRRVPSVASADEVVALLGTELPLQGEERTAVIAADCRERGTSP